jgi:hypothetical protein
MNEPLPNELERFALEEEGIGSPQLTHILELGENLSQCGQFITPPSS